MKLDIEVKPGERLMEGNCIANDEEYVLAPPYMWVVNSSIVSISSSSVSPKGGKGGTPPPFDLSHPLSSSQKL